MFKDAFEFRGFLRLKMNHEFSELEKYYTSDNEYDKNDFMTANEYVPLFWFLHFIINYYMCYYLFWLFSKKECWFDNASKNAKAY
jgi:hypothetical protein